MQREREIERERDTQLRVAGVAGAACRRNCIRPSFVSMLRAKYLEQERYLQERFRKGIITVCRKKKQAAREHSLKLKGVFQLCASDGWGGWNPWGGLLAGSYDAAMKVTLYYK